MPSHPSSVDYLIGITHWPRGIGLTDCLQFAEPFSKKTADAVSVMNPLVGTSSKGHLDSGPDRQKRNGYAGELQKIGWCERIHALLTRGLKPRCVMVLSFEDPGSAKPHLLSSLQ